jgi:hypothetical protein
MRELMSLSPLNGILKKVRYHCTLMVANKRSLPKERLTIKSDAPVTPDTSLFNWHPKRGAPQEGFEPPTSSLANKRSILAELLRQQAPRSAMWLPRPRGNARPEPDPKITASAHPMQAFSRRPFRLAPAFCHSPNSDTTLDAGHPALLP